MADSLGPSSWTTPNPRRERGREAATSRELEPDTPATVSRHLAGFPPYAERICPSPGVQKKGGRWAALRVSSSPRLTEFQWNILVGARPERLIGDVWMRLQLIPELSLDRRDVETDPTIVLT
jgi:hypothetical protein